jgi:hypothetical protein
MLSQHWHYSFGEAENGQGNSFGPHRIEPLVLRKEGFLPNAHFWGQFKEVMVVRRARFSNAHPRFGLIIP